MRTIRTSRNSDPNGSSPRPKNEGRYGLAMVTSFNWDMGWDIRRHDRLRAWSRVVTAGCGLILDRNWGSRNSHLMDREAARGRRRRAELFPQYRHFFRDDGRDRAL